VDYWCIECFLSNHVGALAIFESVFMRVPSCDFVDKKNFA
jgi:hypothetical protein